MDLEQLINGYGILAFRDPFGVRPLVYGRRWVGDKAEYMIASETIALDALGFKEVADVGPGEAIFIDLQGQQHNGVVNEGLARSEKWPPKRIKPYFRRYSLAEDTEKALPFLHGLV